MRRETDSGQKFRRPRTVHTALIAGASAVASLVPIGGQASAYERSTSEEADTQTKFDPKVLIGPVVTRLIDNIYAASDNSPVSEVQKPAVPNTSSGMQPPLGVENKFVANYVWSDQTGDDADVGDSLFVQIYKDNGGREFGHLERESKYRLRSERNLDSVIALYNVNGHATVWSDERLITYYNGDDIEVVPAPIKQATNNNLDIPAIQKEATRVIDIVENYAFQ
jgi:hypothetical protein